MKKKALVIATLLLVVSALPIGISGAIFAVVLGLTLMWSGDFAWRKSFQGQKIRHLAWLKRQHERFAQSETGRRLLAHESTRLMEPAE